MDQASPDAKAAENRHPAEKPGELSGGSSVTEPAFDRWT